MWKPCTRQTCSSTQRVSDDPRLGNVTNDDDVLHIIHGHCFERGRRLLHIVLVEVEQKCVRTMVGSAGLTVIPIRQSHRLRLRNHHSRQLQQPEWLSFIFDTTTLGRTPGWLQTVFHEVLKVPSACIVTRSLRDCQPFVYMGAQN